MKILITVFRQKYWSGGEMYVWDLALELRRQGHESYVYSPELGALADDLRSRGVPVSDRLEDFSFKPDIIHGQHFRPTLQALYHFRGVPAIHVCHDHTFVDDRTPLHPRIYRHFAVSQVCLERVIREGVERHRGTLMLNWVDMSRFPKRGPLPEKPKRALVFSNYANNCNHLTIIREGCSQAGLELDVVGLGVGKPIKEPGSILGMYDLVFAKAKAAMEAMAAGTAVILCDYAGVGPMVDPRNFDSLRPLNFGFASLTEPLQPSVLVDRISHYNAADAGTVCTIIRQEGRLDRTASKLIEIYKEVIKEHKSGHSLRILPASFRNRREMARVYRQDWFLRFRRHPWIRRFMVKCLDI